MVDRQDIDALLIGALYGELTPAEEARLQAHLESHPGDRSALDDLKSARQAVKESRIFDVQAEPPQSLSAMLLQEAHRRAPKKVADGEAKESWFARFVRSFMMHPAMAAAAMLVLVVGVAGTLYLKNGGEIAEKTKSAEPVATAPASPTSGNIGKEAETATATANDQQVAPPSVPSASGSGSASFRADVAEDKDLREKGAQDGAKNVATEKPTAPSYAHHASKTQGIIVHTPEPQPKELAKAESRPTDTTTAIEGDTENAPSVASGRAAPGGGAASTGFAGPVTTTPAPQAAPPPAPAQVTQKAPAPAKAAPRPALDDADVPLKKEAGKQADDLGTARTLHQQAKDAAVRGECNTVAELALKIRSRAPSYYAQNVVTDRDLKKCLSYVANETERDESRKAAKAKAAAPPAAADTKK